MISTEHTHKSMFSTQQQPLFNYNIMQVMIYSQMCVDNKTALIWAHLNHLAL